MVRRQVSMQRHPKNQTNSNQRVCVPLAGVKRPRACRRSSAPKWLPMARTNTLQLLNQACYRAWSPLLNRASWWGLGNVLCCNRSDSKTAFNLHRCLNLPHPHHARLSTKRTESAQPPVAHSALTRASDSVFASKLAACVHSNQALALFTAEHGKNPSASDHLRVSAVFCKLS
jgi:hypothetical protein